MAFVDTSRKRKDGTTAYIVRWDDATGRECQRTYRTSAEAKRALKERIAQEVRDELPDEAAARQSFEKVALAWLASTRRKVKTRTADGYESLLTTHVVPTFGDRRIGSIKAQEIEEWLGRLADSGLTTKTIRNVYTPLAATYRYAVRHGIVRVNPCAGVELPARPDAEEFEGHFLLAEQVEKVAGFLDETSKMHGLVVRFVAGVGPRAAEVSGLRISDIDRERGVVKVRRTFSRDKKTRTWTVGTPKSKRSRREVPILDEELLADLLAYIDQHPRHDDPEALLFYSRVHGGGHAFEPDKPFDADNFARRYLKPALVHAGLPTTARSGVRFHDLRHTAASLWFEAGIPLAVISRWLGHASVAVTDRVYVHLRVDDDYTVWRERFRESREADKQRKVVPLRRKEA